MTRRHLALLAIAFACILGVRATAHAAPDDDLADIEAALADDRPSAPAPNQAASASADSIDKVDIDVVDGPPTWQAFTESWELFRDPIIAAAMAGLVLGFLSVYVILRRMVFVSGAITQAAGCGVAAAFLASAQFGWSVDPVWGATAMSLLAATVLAPDPRRLGLSREMVLGLAYACFAGGVVLASARIPQEAHDVQAILFGTAVVVSRGDRQRLVVIGSIVLLLHLWWFRGLTFASFDQLTARVQRLPVRLLDVVLLLTIGVMVGEAARALGALPAFALSTLPGIAAMQLGRGPLLVTFLIAAVIGAAAGVLGYLAAFFWELPVGATQTAIAVVLVVTALLGRGSGWLLRSLIRRHAPHAAPT